VQQGRRILPGFLPGYDGGRQVGAPNRLDRDAHLLEPGDEAAAHHLGGDALVKQAAVLLAAQFLIGLDEAVAVGQHLVGDDLVVLDQDLGIHHSPDHLAHGAAERILERFLGGLADAFADDDLRRRAVAAARPGRYR
jgi:hypothetical protein